MRYQKLIETVYTVSFSVATYEPDKGLVSSRGGVSSVHRNPEIAIENLIRLKNSFVGQLVDYFDYTVTGSADKGWFRITCDLTDSINEFYIHVDAVQLTNSI